QNFPLLLICFALPPNVVSAWLIVYGIATNLYEYYHHHHLSYLYFLFVWVWAFSFFAWGMKSYYHHPPDHHPQRQQHSDNTQTNHDKYNTVLYTNSQILNFG